VEIFRHFRDYWPKVDQAAFSTAMDDMATAIVVAQWKTVLSGSPWNSCKSFNRVLSFNRELLELTNVIFLGGIPLHGVHFRYPGAIHRARWMAFTIHFIKMWLFRNEYLLHDFRCIQRRRLAKQGLQYLEYDFREYDPSEWGHQDTIQRSRKIVQSVKVVNGLAEHGVALIQEFNLSITRNDRQKLQKQLFLPVVEDHRSAFPAPTKDGAIKRTKAQ